MIRKRIIPVLLLKENKLIHRKNFNEETDIYVGDPINAINMALTPTVEAIAAGSPLNNLFAKFPSSSVSIISS